MFSRSCDVHTCGPGASPLAVSGRHRDADKVRFLKVPVSQTGLFGDAVENMAQQFWAGTGKEGTETSRPVAVASVPPLSGRVTGSVPQ